MKDRIILICCIVLLFFFGIGIFAEVIAPHSPYLVDIENKFLKPSLTYILGTDYLGRCLFSRILYGIRSTLLMSIIVSVISMSFGLIIGIITGFINGWIETVFMKIADILNSSPKIIIVLIVINILGPSYFSLGLAIILTKWILYAKVARNMTKVLKEKEFILSSHLMGTNKFKIIIFELFPNIFPKIISVFTIDFGNIILNIAGYSFLGFGARAPQAELGMMLSEGRDYIYTNSNIMFWPGIVILCIVLNINILGDRLHYKIENKKE